MLQNKEIKTLLKINAITLCLCVSFGMLLSRNLYMKYKQQLLETSASIINNIVLKYPDLETELISNLFTSTNSDLTLFSKYGIDIKSLDYLKKCDYNKKMTYLVLTIFTIIVFLIEWLIYIIFIKKQYKKLRKIDKYMNNILNDNYTLDIREYEEGDLSNLKNDIYKVTIKLKEQSDISKKDKKYLEEILEDISHQLKTPLTSMYVINDILATDTIDIKARKEFLQKNRNQLERIEWLVTSLLKMSRLDSGTVILKKEQVTIYSLIDKSLEPLKVMLDLKNITLITKCPPDLKITVDFNWTSEALINVIKNACEHTPVNGQIDITAEANPIYTSIVITNTGLPIDKKDLPHIFKRFYKGNHNKESIGIGLNMTKKIIDMQNGEISCISTNKTSFIMKFYRNI